MNTFGHKFKISIFGESHGRATGVVIDGVPAGIPLSEQDFSEDILRRKSGAKGTTPRIEDDKPEILTYSLESTIAEKFDAILQRFELTGRMKDFYDIYYLSRKFDFDGLKLQTAIQKTLRNRGTAYEKDSFQRVLALRDDGDMHTKWRYFLRTLGNPEMAFSSVIGGIETFLLPVWDAISNDIELQKVWIATSTKWTDII